MSRASASGKDTDTVADTTHSKPKTLSDQDIATRQRRTGPGGGAHGTDADAHADHDAHPQTDHDTAPAAHHSDSDAASDHDTG